MGGAIDNPAGVGKVSRMWSRTLDTSGNGEGQRNATGVFTGTGIWAAGANVGSGHFYIQPPTGSIYRITRIIGAIRDSKGMVADEYGNLGAALTSGIKLEAHHDGGVVVDLMDGLPVKQNADWSRVCYDVDIKSWGATPSDETLTFRWTFAKAGFPIRLDGNSNEKLQLIVADNVTALITHYFTVQGYEEGVRD